MEQAPDDEEEMWKVLSHAVREAAQRFVNTRTLEGENLKNDLLGKLDYMETSGFRSGSAFSPGDFRISDQAGGQDPRAFSQRGN